MSAPVPGETRPMILVVDDEAPIRAFLRAALESHGYRVIEAETARQAVSQAATRAPDLVLLDLGLPDGDGFEVLRRIREWSSLPILVLSARGRDPDKIRALDSGADDYVTKPFSIGELLARMRAALRRNSRAAGTEEPTIEVGALCVNLDQRRVTLEGEEVRLTPIEYRLLALLARHAGRVMTHEQLLREVWGPPYTTQTHYLRVYMAQLRQKLERDSARPEFLLTEPGVGYRLRSE
jgi:two-component system KDP operon response regulator KdpE